MKGLPELQADSALVNNVDWDMTPEEAVTLYLEWGNNWSHGRLVRSKNDVSYYFVVNTWEKPPRIYLIRRNSEAAEEVAGFDLPEEERDRFLDSVGGNPGVYGLDPPLKAWLQVRLGVERWGEPVS